MIGHAWRPESRGGGRPPSPEDETRMASIPWISPASRPAPTLASNPPVVPAREVAARHARALGRAVAWLLAALLIGASLACWACP